MPKIKSSIKDMRRSARRHEANRQAQSRLKTLIRKTRMSSPENHAANYQAAQKVIDKAVQSGLLHKNTAARYKSRLSRVPATKAAI